MNNWKQCCITLLKPPPNPLIEQVGPWVIEHICLISKPEDDEQIDGDVVFMEHVVVHMINK